MKKHITTEQLDELNEYQRHELWEVWEPREGDYIANRWTENRQYEVFINHMHKPRNKSKQELLVSEKKYYLHFLPTVDQMLQILKNKSIGEIYIENRGDYWTVSINLPNFNGVSLVKKEAPQLCDALWEIIKDVL